MNSTGKNPAVDQKKRTKKILIWVLSIVVGTVVLFYSANAVVTKVRDGKSEETHGQSYVFYPADYDVNIMEDKEYLDLDRSIYYYDPSTGMTSNSFDDVPSSYNQFAAAIADYLNYAIEGKYKAINSMFSDLYYENGGKDKIEFTQQRLYDMLISYNGPTEGREDSFVFTVEYKIMKNDGTFRSDMGSDCSKKEIFTVTLYDDEVEIDSIVVFRTVQK